jgi:hypothetical protein
MTEPAAEAVDPAEDLPPRHPVLAILIVVAGVVLAAMTGATSYLLARDSGADAAGAGTVLVWSLLPAAVLAFGLRLALQTFARRTVGWAPVFLVAYVVSVLVIGLLTLKGSHDYGAVHPVFTNRVNASIVVARR